MLDWRDHIAADPGVMLGKPCIKGTRIPVELILRKLGSGEKQEDLLLDYPRLTLTGIQACLLYAAETVQDDFVQPASR